MKTTNSNQTSSVSPRPRSKRRGFVTIMLLAFAGLLLPNAHASGADISYWGTQPAGKPAFGQTVLVTGAVYGTPMLAGLRVQLWFSGRHGVRDRTYTVVTNPLGHFSAQMTIPRAWSNRDTWVDVNISCPSIGKLRLFRVRNK